MDFHEEKVHRKGFELGNRSDEDKRRFCSSKPWTEAQKAAPEADS